MKTRKSLEHLSWGAMSVRHRPLLIDPTEYADTLFGVGSATSAGPTLPAGSIHPSPETLDKDCGGYYRDQPIVGFGHAYISGAGGVKCYGNYLLCPMLGGVEIDHEKRASFAVQGTEKGRVYEYSVELENGIKTRFTPQHNSAIHTIEYPKGKDASLLIDVAHKLDLDAALKNGYVTVDPQNRTVCGGGRYFGNWNEKDWDMFFYMQIDTDGEMGIMQGNRLRAVSQKTTVGIADPQRLGAYVKFGSVGETVKVKIAISFTGVAKAKEFLDEQIPDFDYESVRDRAREKWRSTLGAIEFQTTDEKLLRRFYTAMYHMNVQPRDRVSDNGSWDDFHTVWDTWKTVFPMYSLLYPEKMADIVESFIDRAKKNKELGNGIVVADEFSTAHETLGGQGGNDVDNVIAHAYLSGVTLKKYDWEDAYATLLESAEKMRSPEYVNGNFATDNRVTVSGVPYTWRFKSAVATMGFALNDRAIATVARELGTPEQHEKYLKRSKKWKNVWNRDLCSEGFYAFPQRPLPDGTFEDGFDAHGGYNSHFYEMTGWDASYVNYNDVSGLVEMMGGADTFTKRLLWACEHSVNYYNDDNGKEGYLNFTNEPSFHIPWLFCTDEIRRPDLASRVIDGVIKRFSLENDYPGDEDNGGMSSYYVFLMCGVFPYATTENYYLHGTRLDKITFRLGNGREFTVTGENVGDENIYVQSATWQGRELDECKLTHADILEGGELHFVMGDKPSDWARKNK